MVEKILKPRLFGKMSYQIISYEKESTFGKFICITLRQSAFLADFKSSLFSLLAGSYGLIELSVVFDEANGAPCCDCD